MIQLTTAEALAKATDRARAFQVVRTADKP